MSQWDVDIGYMRQALACADQAEKKGEIPIGAILLLNNRLVVSAYNQTIEACDPTAHAEILVLRRAAKMLNQHRLLGATLYVTLEPCTMCLGALVQARIKRLVFGAYNNRFSRAGSLCNFLQTKGRNHSFIFTDGILADECAKKLQQFFLLKRQKSLVFLSDGFHSI